MKAALHLLGTYGGVGARSRKGFGSLQVTWDGTPPPALDDLLELAAALRKKCGLKNSAEENNAELRSSAFLLGRNPLLKTITIKRRNAWHALDALGAAYQARLRTTPRDARKAFGLPRATEEKKRYASPLHFHFAPGTTPDEFILTAVAFPQQVDELKTGEVENTFRIFFQSFGIAPEPNAANNQRHPSGHSPSTRGEIADRRPPRTPVKLKIIGLRPKRNGYDVQEEGRNPGTLCLGDPPLDLQPGQIVDAETYIDDLKNPQYRWPPGNRPGNQKSKH